MGPLGPSWGLLGGRLGADWTILHDAGCLLDPLHAATLGSARTTVELCWGRNRRKAIVRYFRV
eukprot:4584137-Pyramimonas_sp.AAC.1